MRLPNPFPAVLLAIAIACAMLVCPMPAHAAAPVRPLVPGDTLPPLVGEYLTGREAVVPRDSKGRVAFLALGFSYKSRLQVEAWGKRFQQAHGSTPGVTFYEVPVMGGMARVARPMIDRGMRRGTPVALHENVITVWQQGGEWRKRMGHRDPDAAYLALLDGEGVVRWLHTGPLDDAAWASLEQAVAAARR